MFKSRYYENNKEAIDFILDVFKKNKSISFFLLLFSALGGIIGITLPILAKFEIDQLSYKYNNFYKLLYGNPFHIFLYIIAAIFILNFLSYYMSRISQYYMDIKLEKIKNDFFLSLYKKLKNIEPGFFSNSKNNRIILDSISDSWFIREIINMVKDVMNGVITLVGVVSVFVFLDYKILIVMAILSVFYYLVNMKKESNSIYDYFSKYEILGKMDFMKREVIENFNNVGISGGTKLIFSYIEEGNEILQKVDREYKKKEFFYSNLLMIINMLSSNLIKVIVGYSIYYAGGSIGLMTMTVMYSAQVNMVVYGFLMNKFSSDKVAQNIGNLGHFLFLTQEKDYKTEDIFGVSEITIKNLRFNYPKISENELKYFNIVLERLKKYDNKYWWGKNKIHYLEELQKEAGEISPEILKGINLKLKKGEIAGIVGKNGAGKTTLTNLIMNFYDSYEGNILFDNVECRNLKHDFFFENLGVITQIPYNMKRLSVKENLTLGSKKEYSDEELFRFLDKFGLRKKVEKMRKGLDSEIGYDSYFSGGEQQLLVLIRLIIQDKPILIFDEGTNQLDAENEVLVMNELLKNKKDKIIIFVTHRMTTIKKADKIYCIEDGVIKDSGNHKELLGKDTLYKKLWDHQVESGFSD